MAYEAKILLDSVSPDGVRLVTYSVTYPRFVHAELMTHRVFSRNSASSRAIPVAKMLERVKTDPAGPVWWGRNQAGMQANEELIGADLVESQKEWLLARDSAVAHVEQLMKAGLHKQITNRLLEPWLWHTIIVTATEWRNYFALRCHKDAQPEIRKAAVMMKELYESSVPRALDYNEWHLPLVSLDEFLADKTKGHSWDYWKKVSAGRCARVSYLTHDGKRDPEADIELCERLAKSGHMSPLEHVARPAHWNDLTSDEDAARLKASDQFFGNFRGWIQFRKELPNEAVFINS